MHVIEPASRQRLKKDSGLENTHRKWTVGIVLLFLGFIILGWYAYRLRPQVSGIYSFSINNHNSKLPVATIVPKPTSLRIFTPEEFKQLYSNFAYPNTTPILEPPVISGNQVADERIRTLAIARGYTLKRLPASPIVKLNEPNLEGDDLIQPLAYGGWQILKAEAKADNIPLGVISAYRSPDYQRQLFLGRISATGVTIDQIAAGEGDAAVNQALEFAAPPGYSRHHTGFTMDLECSSGTVSFAGSICYTWISKNNYEKAKKAGWIPSYPAGIINPGPEPEPWEYVWVGVDAVSNH